MSLSSNVRLPPIADMRRRDLAFDVYSVAAPFCLGFQVASAPYEERRAFPRVPVAMPAFLQADGERYAVHILDLSAGGAKLRCSATVSAGTTVVLDCGTLRRSAVVRWKTGDLLGVCFDSELDAREVTAVIGRSIALDAFIKTRDNP